MSNSIEKEPNTAAAKLRVLIADDKAETRRSTRLMLTLIPEVEIMALAHNGREAIELAREHRPDIALMDVNMPGMTGLEAIAHMRQQQPNLACIVISAEQQRHIYRSNGGRGTRLHHQALYFRSISGK
jgi:DNA-binding NarL/FixJ family response regulator